MNVHSGFTHNGPDLETTQTSTVWWTGKQTGASVRLGTTQKQSSGTGSIPNEPLEHFATQKKSLSSSNIKITHDLTPLIWNSRKGKLPSQEPASRGRECLHRDVKRHSDWCKHSITYLGGGYKTVCICQNSENCTCKSWQILLYINQTHTPTHPPPPPQLQGVDKEWQSEREQLSPGLETNANVRNFSSYVLKKIKVFSNTANHCVCQLHGNLPEPEYFSGESAAAESGTRSGCVWTSAGSSGLPSADCCAWVRET